MLTKAAQTSRHSKIQQDKQEKFFAIKQKNQLHFFEKNDPLDQIKQMKRYFCPHANQ